MTFSERMGYLNPKVTLQKNDMDLDLRNGLWNCLVVDIFNNFSDYDRVYATRSTYVNMRHMLNRLWIDFFKAPIDESPQSKYDFVEIIKKWYFKCEWYSVYDFIEFIILNHKDSQETQRLIDDVNMILKRELSAYRLISSVFTPITSDTDISEIEKAMHSPINEVNLHLNRSLELLADRKAPDYRNSIKEAISAVETMCKKITGDKNATLGDALNKLEKGGKIKIHTALNGAFKNLYGYTNDADGIRHSLMREEHLDYEDAIFMLTSCSAFINYLLIKSTKLGINLSK